jgi:hypothetical protein
VLRLVRLLGLLQIDSVNVLVRAQYLPVFSRLGAYDPAVLDAMANTSPRVLFEYWGHEASLLPVEVQPLLRWRMARAHDEAWGGMRRIVHERPDLPAAVLAVLAEHGPLPVAQVEQHLGVTPDRPAEGWGWRWSEVKRAVELAFWAGEITVARRGNGFERWYDLPERVLPRDILAIDTPDPADAVRGLVAHAGRAHGVATERCLRDYYRLPVDGTRRAVAELVEAGELRPVAVEGWTRTAFVHRDARIPRRLPGCTVLSPFDPLVFERTRTERLFGFRYRIGIYTPAARRTHGYYALPVLLGDALVARVDLKADRATATLHVLGAWAEPDAAPDTPVAVTTALDDLAGWLGLDQVVDHRRGDLRLAG